MMIHHWVSRQIKVVHRLPGRLRLSIPSLELLPDGYLEYITLTEKLLIGLPGMQEVTINCGTASALILYESTDVSEKIILGWVKQLIGAAVKFHNQLRNCANNNHLRLHKTRVLLQQEVRSIKKRYVQN